MLSEKTAADALKSLTVNSDSQTELQTSLDRAQKNMQAALSDSFNTPRAMQVLHELIKEANIHIQTNRADVDLQGLEAAARWVTKMVGIFGLDANASPPYDGLGWASKAASLNISPQEAVKPFAEVLRNVKDAVKLLSVQSEPLDKLLAADVDSEFESLVSAGTTDLERLYMPYLRTISKIRDEIRQLAPSSPSKKGILALSDLIRDDYLTNLGVYLDDRPDGLGALIKFIPREELLAQREEKAAKEQEKLAQKEAAKAERERILQEKAEKAKVSPLDMFRNDKRFSAWDEEGLPTKTEDGKDVTNNALKKMKKDWERQKKAHEEWKAKSGA